MGVSEIARIKESIAVEYMAAKLGLFGLASGSSRHRFITARQERIGVLHEQLQTIVGEQAIAMVAEIIDHLPEKPTRHNILTVLRYELGNTEKTEHLVDWIQGMWETIDLLVQEFGTEGAQKIVKASDSIFLEIPKS